MSGRNLTSVAVMSSVSEFIGFIVISVFPSQNPKGANTRDPFFRQKSDDALIANDERSSEDTDSDVDTVSLPNSSRAQLVPAALAVNRPKPAEPSRNPALSKPDFWMIAIIMSMRIFPSCPLTNL
jgi:hypothetical protein